MIYEIFKTIIGTDWNWFKFAGATLVATYAIYIGAWLAGFLITKGYEFIQDGEATIPNFMKRFLDKFLFIRGESFPKGFKLVWDLLPDERAQIPHEFEDMTYYFFKDGKLHTASRNLLRMEQLGRRLRDDLSAVRLRGVERERIPYIDYNTFPLAAGSTLLLIDVAPLFALMCGVCYGVLLLARSCVRVSKKLNKHIKDTEAHKESGDA